MAEQLRITIGTTNGHVFEVVTEDRDGVWRLSDGGDLGGITEMATLMLPSLLLQARSWASGAEPPRLTIVPGAEHGPHDQEDHRS
jgi:hypothetical protein